MFSTLFTRFTLWAAGNSPAPEGVPADGTAQLLGTFLPLIALVGIFYFLIIRPESKRKKAAQQLRKELIVGDEITTIGGIVGRVISIKDDSIIIESGADKNKIKIMRWAVSSKGEQVSN